MGDQEDHFSNISTISNNITMIKKYKKQLENDWTGQDAIALRKNDIIPAIPGQRAEKLVLALTTSALMSEISRKTSFKAQEKFKL